MARNKAIAEAKAIDLSPVKVLIIGAGPTGPQHLQSSLTRAESIFTEADTEQKRKREGKTDADAEATRQHCWPAFLTQRSNVCVRWAAPTRCTALIRSVAYTRTVVLSFEVVVELLLPIPLVVVKPSRARFQQPASQLGSLPSANPTAL